MRPICAFSLCLILLNNLLLSVAPGQEPEPQPSKIDVMLQVVLSDKTDTALRQANVATLLNDPLAHEPLAAILQSDDHPQAKRIICQALATRPLPLDQIESKGAAPETFIDPLFAALVSTDEDLSYWAGQVLSRCQNGIIARLNAMAKDHQLQLRQRLIAIDTLKMITGREAVLTLGELLTDPDTQVNQRAGQALAFLMGLNEPINAHQYQTYYLELISDIDEIAFLWWQTDWQRRQLRNAHQLTQQQQRQTDYWQQQALEALTREFNRLPETDRLPFVQQQLEANTQPIIKGWALERIRDWAVTGSLALSATAPTAVAFLTPHINDPQPRVRLLTAQALGALAGQDAAKALAPQLLEQLQQADSLPLQSALLETLGNLNCEAAYTPAVKFLDSSEPELVMQAARTLRKLIVTGNTSITPPQLEGLIEHLAGAYQRASAELRPDLMLLILKVCDQPNLHEKVKPIFSSVFRQALTDENWSMRRSAVHGLTQLYQQQSLSLLFDGTDPLADSDAQVRFAVLDTLKLYGQADQLPRLHERLTQETDEEVAKAIQDVYLTILQQGSLDTIYQQIQSLHGQSGRITALYERALPVLLSKITEMKTAEKNVPASLEADAYIKQAQWRIHHGQPDQAVNWFARALRLELPPPLRQDYQKQLFTLAIDNAAQPALVAPIAEIFNPWLTQASDPAAFSIIDKHYQQLNTQTEIDIIAALTILADFIGPVTQFPDPQTEQLWLQRKKQASQRAIENQLNQLANEKSLNPAILTLLGRVDPRLKDIPTDADPKTQQAKLNGFLTILNPPAPKPQPEPEKSKPAAQSKPDPKPESEPASQPTPEPAPAPKEEAQPASTAQPKPQSDDSSPPTPPQQ